MVYGFTGQKRTGMTIITIHDIVNELKEFELEAGLLPAPKDRWVFRFAKEYMIVLGSDCQRLVLSARNPEQVMMRYSVD